MLINESVRKGYGLDVHSKESCGTIRKSKFSWKLALVPDRKEQDTKRKYESDGGKVEDHTPVATFDTEFCIVYYIQLYTRIYAHNTV